MKGLIMSGLNVEKILQGKKTETRRVIAPQPVFNQVYDYKGVRLYDGENRRWCWKKHVSDIWTEFPQFYAPLSRFEAGETYYLKEQWGVVNVLPTHCEPFHDPFADGLTLTQSIVAGRACGVDIQIVYAAQEDRCGQVPVQFNSERLWVNYSQKSPWETPLFMPKWASRCKVLITSVRVERLHDITEDGAITEGCEPDNEIVCGVSYEVVSARTNYIGEWNKHNEKRGFPWSSNPWVEVIEMEVVN